MNSSDRGIRPDAISRHGADMIETFRVQNFKALRDVTLNLTPIHLLIGPNDSGKTSILEAVAALCRSVDRPILSAFCGRWQGTELVTDANADTSIELECHCNTQSEFEYRLETEFARNGKAPRIQEELLDGDLGHFALRPADGGHKESLVNLWNSRSDIALSRTLSLTQMDPSRAFSEVYDALSGVHLYRWNARLLSIPCALDTSSGFEMHASGFGLARSLDAILSYDRLQFDALEKRFKGLFSEVEAIRLISTHAFSTPSTLDELVPKLTDSPGKGIYLRFRQHSFDVPASQVSEGMLLVLAYLAVLYSPSPPRVLMVEEPENGLHPSRLASVVSMLRELVSEQSRTQVILTSHSPYIVSLFQPEEVTLCRKNAEGHVEVRRLSESKLVQQQSDVFSLGEIWPAEEEAIFAESSEQPTVTETQP